MNNDYKASDMQLPLIFIQQIGGIAEFIQRVIVDLLNLNWTKSNIRFYQMKFLN